MIERQIDIATMDGASSTFIVHPERDGRVRRGEQARLALIQSALWLMEEGNFRPSAQDIARGAGLHPSAVNRLFGSLELMMRVIAREHWVRVVPFLPFDTIGIAEIHFTVWTVLVGKPRELS